MGCAVIFLSVPSFILSPSRMPGVGLPGRDHCLLPADFQHGSRPLQGPLRVQGQHDRRHRAAPHHRAERCRALSASLSFSLSVFSKHLFTHAVLPCKVAEDFHFHVGMGTRIYISPNLHRQFPWQWRGNISGSLPLRPGSEWKQSRCRGQGT